MRETAADALAAWRLTRLITADSFPPVERLREAVAARYGSTHWASYLVNCPHCMGVWVGAGVTVARRLAPRAWGPVAELLALAAIASLTTQAANKLEAAGPEHSGAVTVFHAGSVNTTHDAHQVPAVLRGW